MIESIAVDCMVRRSSGGPMMMVLAVYGSDSVAGTVARCAWFDGYKLDSATIAINQLDLMSKP